MSLTYAVPDLHGRYDLFRRALNRIEGHASAPSRIVFLGDYIDRGPESRRIVESLMAGPPTDEWRWTCLKGNHEDMMVRCIRGQAPLGWWLENGGSETLSSYGQRRPAASDPGSVLATHLEWMDGLPLMHVDEHRVFVHAGVDPSLPLDEQDAEDLLWKRYRDYQAGGHLGRHVVHGHTPIPDGPLLLPGRTDLDTYAWKTGRLVVGVFNDEIPGGPIDLLEVGDPRRRALFRLR